MLRKKKYTDDKVWLTTYSDIITILLVFFILFYSLTKNQGTSESKELEIVLSIFKSSIGVLPGGLTFEEVKLQNLGMSFSNLHSSKQNTKLSDLNKAIIGALQQQIQDKEVQIRNIEKGVVVSLVGINNFLPGSAEITQSTKNILSKISGVLRQFPYYIRIEGHSDKDNINFSNVDSPYADNWELSAQRSINTLKYLQESSNVAPNKMSAVSYGKYRNIINPDTPEEESFNRRVEIYILPDKQYIRDYRDGQLPENKVPGSEFTGE